jgi:hypothetical protein
MSQTDAKLRLSCKIEALRVSRLPLHIQDQILENLQTKLKSAKGMEKKRLNLIIETLEKQQSIADEAFQNMDFTNGGGNGVGGSSGGGNPGNSAG